MTGAPAGYTAAPRQRAPQRRQPAQATSQADELNNLVLALLARQRMAPAGIPQEQQTAAPAVARGMGLPGYV